MKTLLLLNPISGRGVIKNHLLDIISQLSSQGHEVTVYPTKAKGDATLYMTQAKGYDWIVVSGGDGTLNEVITGVIQEEIKVPIGYIPTGTTNDFATGLSISRQIPEAVSQFVTGVICPLDVGKFQERYFTYVAAFGAFTDVAYETPQLRKNLLGRLAYVIEGILKVPTITSYSCTITHDEGVLSGDFVFGMISNSDSVAGITHTFGQRAQLNDGVFEVTLVKMPQNVMDFQGILGDLLNKEVNPDYIMTFKTKHIQIDSTTAVKWTLDGEDGGLTESVTITNLHQKIQLVLPQTKKLRDSLTE